MILPAKINRLWRYPLPFVYTAGVCLLLAVIFYPVMDRYSQSFKFVDEDEYIVNAWLMNKGYRLYQDISTNHQPMTYFLSQITQKMTQPANDVMLVRRHRQAIYIWNIGWWFFLIWRFKKRAIFPIVFYEGLKYLTLGNEFVAESLVAYPMAYVFLNVYESVVEEKNKHDDVILGVVSAAIPFFLLPLALPVGILVVWRYIKLKGYGIRLFGVGFLGVLIGLSLYIRPSDYWRETVVNNYRYAIPRISQMQTGLDYLKMLGLPFLKLNHLKDVLNQWVALIMAGWLTGLVILIAKRKYRLALSVVGLWFIWQLTNLRVVHPGTYFFEAFHLTPWYLVGLSGMVFIFSFALRSIRIKWRYVLGISAGLICVALVFSRQMPYQTRIDPQTEHYIQFTPVEQAAQVINTVKQPGDRLMVYPNEVLIHWLTQLEPGSRQVTYYEWQYYPPRSQEEYLTTMTHKRPTFIVVYDEGSVYMTILPKILAESYWQIFKGPNVYMRKDAIPQLSQAQRDQFAQLPLGVDQIVPLPVNNNLD